MRLAALINPSKRLRQELQCESLNSHTRIRAEIDQQSELVLRHSQIIENLPTVFVGQSAHRLELQDYLSKAKDIRYVLLLDLLALVEDRQFLLGLKRNVPQGEFLLKALLIDLFAPHVAHRLVDVKYSALNGIHLVTIKQLVFHIAYYIILRRRTRPRTLLRFPSQIDAALNPAALFLRRLTRLRTLLRFRDLS